MADTEHDADAFREKLRAWRQGGMGISFGGRDGIGSRQTWHEEPSRFQKEKNIIADLTSAGLPFDRAPSR